MASLTITLTDICSGGNHLKFEVTGARTQTIHGLRDEMSEPVTEEEAAAFLKVVCKLAKSGRTVAQARTVLQNGVTVNI